MTVPAGGRSTRPASAWLSGLILGAACGLLLLEFGVLGVVFLAASLGVIAWKGPRLLAISGLVTGFGLILSVLFANVSINCAFPEPGTECEAGGIWWWVAASVGFFVGGLVASALALRRSRAR